MVDGGLDMAAAIRERDREVAGQQPFELEREPGAPANSADSGIDTSGTFWSTTAPPQNTASPLNRTETGAPVTRNETWPRQWPGVATAWIRRRPTDAVQPSSRATSTGHGSRRHSGG